MRFSEKQLTVLTIGISGVLALALAGVGYFVLSKKLSKLKNDLTNAEKQIKQYQKKLEERHLLIERVEKLRENKKDLEEIVPLRTKKVYEKFIDTLDQLGKDAGVTLHRASSVKQHTRGRDKQPAGPVGLEEISYKLTLTGEFFELIKFVYLLETYKRFIRVDEFSLRPKNIKEAVTSNKDITHTMNIQITTYAYNQ